MKKKRTMIVIVIMIVAVIAIVVLLDSWLWMHANSRALGNMNLVFYEPITSASAFSFKGEAGDKIKIKFSADKRNENLEIILYDSEGNAVYELDNAKEIVAYYTLEKTDEYTLTAEYSDYEGKFKVAVYKVN